MKKSKNNYYEINFIHTNSKNESNVPCVIDKLSENSISLNINKNILEFSIVINKENTDANILELINHNHITNIHFILYNEYGGLLKDCEYLGKLKLVNTYEKNGFIKYLLNIELISSTVKIIYLT